MRQMVGNKVRNGEYEVTNNVELQDDHVQSYCIHRLGGSVNSNEKCLVKKQKSLTVHIVGN